MTKRTDPVHRTDPIMVSKSKKTVRVLAFGQHNHTQSGKYPDMTNPKVCHGILLRLAFYTKFYEKKEVEEQGLQSVLSSSFKQCFLMKKMF